MSEQDPPIEELMEKLVVQARAVAWKYWHSAPYVLEFDELVSLANIGLTEAHARWPAYCEKNKFDPATTRFFTEYCCVPETPVLTAELDWVPAGDLVFGQELVGVDEEAPSVGYRRRLRSSLVQEAERRMAQCVRMFFVDGRVVTCSIDHLWLASWRGSSNTQYNWRPAGKMKPGMSISSPLRTWYRDDSYDAGWLAGIIDGEANYVRKSQEGLVYGYEIAQNKGAVLDKVLRLLDQMEIEYCTLPYLSPSGKVCVHVNVTQLWASVKLAGMLRMERLPGRPVWENRAAQNKKGMTKVEIVGIEDAGVREVVKLETSTHTYLANGLVAHNCLRRMRGSILDYMRSQDWVSRTVRDRSRSLRDAGQDQGATQVEMAATTGMTRQQVSETLAAMARRPTSFDPAEHDVRDAEDTESSAVVGDLLRVAVETLQGLPLPVQFVLVLTFYFGLNVKQAAAALGMESGEALALQQQGVLAVHSTLAHAAKER